MELYYSIVNIVDFLALNEVEQTEKSKLLLILDSLLTFTGETIADISSANDCGFCESWEEYISKTSELFKTGERI